MQKVRGKLIKGGKPEPECEENFEIVKTKRTKKPANIGGVKSSAILDNEDQELAHDSYINDEKKDTENK